MDEKLITENIFRKQGTYWSYSGQNGEPHALLTKGGHSDGYFNVPKVLAIPNFRKIFAKLMVAKLKKQEIENIGAVVSSSYAAVPIGQAVSDELGVPSFYAEKDGKNQAWTGRFEISEDMVVLHVEELITSIGTTRNVRDTILKNNNSPVKFAEINGKTLVLTIIHRPENLPVVYDDYEVVALLEKEVHNWNSKKCPLCKIESKALPPKANWNIFSKYI